MNLHTYFARADRPVDCCVVGTGGFGQTFVKQARRTPLLNVRIAIDVDAKTAASVLVAAGVEARRITICQTANEAMTAWDRGDHIASANLEIVIDLPFDIVVEATGRPEAGARHCKLAIDAGKHVALVSKEVDSVVGPGLVRAAKERGCVLTCVDGDQPSLLINLVSWAEVLGLTIVAAGKSSEYDFVFDQATGRVTSFDRAMDVPQLARQWAMENTDAGEIVSARARMLDGFPQRAVPDLCELGIVANATGCLPDRPDFHAPIARPIEVPSLFSTKNDGGILGGERRIDVFHCLRRPDEASFAGGVFVVVKCDDADSWEMLREKGHIVSRTGSTAMLYLPRHILGLEAATSILDAVVHRVSGYGEDYRPLVDLVAVATKDLPGGTVLQMGGHHHTIDGVTAELRPAAELTSNAAAPFYIAADRRLTRSIRKGDAIVMGDLDGDNESELLSLRRQQDLTF